METSATGLMADNGLESAISRLRDASHGINARAREKLHRWKIGTRLVNRIGLSLIGCTMRVLEIHPD